MNILERKKHIVNYFLKKNILITPEHLVRLDQEDMVTHAYSLMEQNLLSPETLFSLTPIRPKLTTKVVVKMNYTEYPRKRTVEDFVSFYSSRHGQLSKILRGRQELADVTSISRILAQKDRQRVAIIGLVLDKNETKNGNIMLTLEDPTGIVKVVVSKTKKDLLEQAKDLVYDEVVGAVGTSAEGIIFCESLLHPDIPLTKEFKKGPTEVYAAFLSDIHVGSNNFLKEEFTKFIRWASGKTGTEEQRRMAERLRYIFIIGDLVDGVGIYPGQEEELSTKDLTQQYNEFAEYLKELPPDIHIIICPGNHDAMRLCEPQLALYPDIAKALYDVSNVIMVSSPSLINIASDERFSGFDILMYHGYSFDFYAANVESIRANGGYDRSDLIMKFILQRRHLAPTHTSTLYIPQEKDHLVIDQVPDFFVTGHIHKSCAANYRNITMISGSCFQKTTAFQEKVGHHPEPGRVPVVDLSTRKVKIMRF